MKLLKSMVYGGEDTGELDSGEYTSSMVEVEGVLLEVEGVRNADMSGKGVLYPLMFAFCGLLNAFKLMRWCNGVFKILVLECGGSVESPGSACEYEEILSGD